ncbi:MAG: putative endopeptidase [Bradyrhizobium sp.]|nr:putative endopeptidase [Bradyrhizobium sp.]
MRLTFALIGVSAAALLGCSPASEVASVPPAAPQAATAPGALAVFDPSLVDASVDPCHDLYRYACGGWIKNNPPPADQPRYGRFNELQNRNRDVLRQLLDDAVAHPTDANRKVADFYKACTDEAVIDAKGLDPLKPMLARIAALHNKKELAGLLAELHGAGVNALFGFGEESDFKDAAHSIAAVSQGGLGLPDRDYYFKADEKSVQQRAGYEAHIAKMLVLLGDAPDKATAAAKSIVALETALAKPALNRVHRRDPSAIYHKMPTAKLNQLAPDFAWSVYFKDAGAPGFRELNISEPAFVKGVEGVIKTTSLDTLKSYLRWHLVRAASPMLSKPFVDENFAFYGQTMRGAKELEPRWRRCVIATDGALGEALGRLYVDKAFGPASKDRMEQLVADLRASYAKDLDSLPWMGAETKKRAEEKLAAMVDKIGYPEKWRDYSSLEVKSDDALGNVGRAEAFETRRELAKIGKTVDRTEWGMTPPTVNAYYSPEHNDINFPAGILQAPFFNLGADDASNYGAIGAVIGHEMTHGFDDQGRLFDKDGNLNDWWTKDDAKNFEERARCLSDQAGGFTAVDDVKLNGSLTLGENTADNGGTHIAYAAFKARTAGQPDTKVGGFTTDQRFFLAYAQVWCSTQTPETARFMALNDPHPAAEFRVNGVISNMAEFGKAFSCPAAAPMARANACRVW